MTDHIQPAPEDTLEFKKRLAAAYFEGVQIRLEREAELADLRLSLRSAEQKNEEASQRLVQLEGELQEIRSSRWEELVDVFRSSAFRRRRSGRDEEELRPASTSRAHLNEQSTKNADSLLNPPGYIPPKSGNYAEASVVPFYLQGRAAWEVTGKIGLYGSLQSGRHMAFPKSDHPRASIIVVTYNKAYLTYLTLQSILDNCTAEYELVVVDNNSSDETSQLLAGVENATIIRNSENLGFGLACMQAAEQCRGDFLCLLNSDALLHANALSAALNNFQELTSVGAVGGKILLADGRLQEAGCLLWCDGTADGYGRGEDPEALPYNFRRPVDYCSAVFLVTPKNVFNELGGFDPQFAPGYFEDTDYCLRVWKSGRKVIYDPRILISHYESASSGADGTKLRLIRRNHRRFFEKWRNDLADFLEPKGENINRGRIAKLDTGLRILFVGDGLQYGGSSSGESAPSHRLRSFIQEGHHVSLAAIGNEMSEYHDQKLRDLEILDLRSGLTEVLGKSILTADVIWLRHETQLQQLVDAIDLTGHVPPLIVIEASGASNLLSDTSKYAHTPASRPFLAGSSVVWEYDLAVPQSGEASSESQATSEERTTRLVVVR